MNNQTGGTTGGNICPNCGRCPTCGRSNGYYPIYNQCDSANSGNSATGIGTLPIQSTSN